MGEQPTLSVDGLALLDRDLVIVAGQKGGERKLLPIEKADVAMLGGKADPHGSVGFELRRRHELGEPLDQPFRIRCGEILHHQMVRIFMEQDGIVVDLEGVRFLDVRAG